MAFTSASPTAVDRFGPFAGTGQAAMTPTILSHLTPMSALASKVRLSLHPRSNRRAPLDGAWWPRSRDAAAELPGLIAAIDRRLGQATSRVSLHRSAWNRVPRRIPGRGRQVSVGWFRHADPHVITLTFADAEAILLLVIPPDTATGAAKAAIRLTAQDTTGVAPADILAIAQISPAQSTRTTDADGLTRWENEGGHIPDYQPGPPAQ
ncbi:DUF5994 family protein [Nonomuraea sp. NPDC050451]|uniref:DUF5994 family protein n=1 Tax=Nonomuraea sp. NPDC050451 TaxID=3364364 RepID=UPI0037B4EFB8